MSNPIRDAYAQGFATKCVEAGISPHQIMKVAQEDQSTMTGQLLGGLGGFVGGNVAAAPIARRSGQRTMDLLLQALRQRPVMTTPEGVDVFAAKGSPVIQQLLRRSRMAGLKGGALSLMTVLGLTGAGAYGGRKIQQRMQAAANPSVLERAGSTFNNLRKRLGGAIAG